MDLPPEFLELYRQLATRAPVSLPHPAGGPTFRPPPEPSGVLASLYAQQHAALFVPWAPQPSQAAAPGPSGPPASPPAFDQPPTFYGLGSSAITYRPAAFAGAGAWAATWPAPPPPPAFAATGPLPVSGMVTYGQLAYQSLSLLQGGPLAPPVQAGATAAGFAGELQLAAPAYGPVPASDSPLLTLDLPISGAELPPAATGPPSAGSQDGTPPHVSPKEEQETERESDHSDGKDHGARARYACDLCDKTFVRNYVLKRHRRMHFEEKSFTCPIPGCPRTFYRVDGMKAHHRMHLRRLTPAEREEVARARRGDGQADGSA